MRKTVVHSILIVVGGTRCFIFSFFFCIFIRVDLSQTNDMPGSQTSSAPENDGFAVLFMHLDLRRECKDYTKAGESKAGKPL